MKRKIQILISVCIAISLVLGTWVTALAGDPDHQAVVINPAGADVFCKEGWFLWATWKKVGHVPCGTQVGIWGGTTNEHLCTSPEGQYMRKADLRIISGGKKTQPVAGQSSTTSSTDVVERLVIVAGSLVNHLPGSGDAYPVTFRTAKEVIGAAFNSAGQVYTRWDGRFFIVTKNGGIRYVAFLNADGSLGTHFVPAGGQACRAVNYINNVIQKGSYYEIDPEQVPERIRELWVTKPWWQTAAAVLGGGLSGVSEFFFPAFLMSGELKDFLQNPGAPVSPTKL